jgi:hypothetical protein
LKQKQSGGTPWNDQVQHTLQRCGQDDQQPEKFDAAKKMSERKNLEKLENFNLEIILIHLEYIDC